LFAAEARLRLLEWETEDWLRSGRPGRSQRAVDPEDAQDERWARFMLATPSHYAIYRGIALKGLSVATVTRLVRQARLADTH
jgi:hypothetical protein